MQILLKRIYFILFHFIHFIFHFVSFHGKWFNPLPQQKRRGEGGEGGVHTMLNISDIPNDSFLCMDMKKSRDWNTRLVSSGVSLTLWGEGASIALVGHRSSDRITIEIPYRVDVLLHWPALHPIFSYYVG